MRHFRRDSRSARQQALCGKDSNSIVLNRIKTQRSGFDPERRCDEMSEKWLLSRCEGYAVRIDEVSAGLQAPVTGQRTGDEWGSGGIPGPVFGSFLLVQKGTHTGVRNPLISSQKTPPRKAECSHITISPNRATGSFPVSSDGSPEFPRTDPRRNSGNDHRTRRPSVPQP